MVPFPRAAPVGDASPKAVTARRDWQIGWVRPECPVGQETGLSLVEGFALTVERWRTNKGRGAEGAPARSSDDRFESDVVVQREFVRMRAQADGIGLAAALVRDEGLEQLFAEDVAFQQEGVVVFKAGERFVE